MGLRNGAYGWRKSSRSNNVGECVEVSYFRPDIAVRDSKDPAGPLLTFGDGAWQAFVAGVRTGRFDR
jgi:hypothetical protein